MPRRADCARAAPSSPPNATSRSATGHQSCSAPPTSRRQGDAGRAKLRLDYTKIVAPFDGVTGERQVPGDYVNIGTNLINVMRLPDVYVIASYKETSSRG
jgi:multidrug resistance efflux pump